MKTIPSWSILLKLATSLSKGAIAILFLIYAIFFLKKIGIETTSMEITLAGGILLLSTIGIIKIIAPAEILAFKDQIHYEAYILEQVAKEYIPKYYFDPHLKITPITSLETKQFGYIFDGNFSNSIEDLKTVLTETGYIALVTKVLFARKDKSQPIVRASILLLITTSVVLMYSKPLCMLAYIYF